MNPLFGPKLKSKDEPQLAAAKIKESEMELSQKAHLLQGGTIKQQGNTFVWRDSVGKVHRADGPAIYDITPESRLSKWYKHGKYHRENGPAIELYNGAVLVEENWFYEGELHRADGPAFFHRASYHVETGWYQHGKVHCLTGPAKIFHHTTENIVVKEWFVLGQRHRTDGPALEHSNTKNQYYLHDKKLSKLAHKLKT